MPLPWGALLSVVACLCGRLLLTLFLFSADVCSFRQSLASVIEPELIEDDDENVQPHPPAAHSRSTVARQKRHPEKRGPSAGGGTAKIRPSARVVEAEHAGGAAGLQGHLALAGDSAQVFSDIDDTMICSHGKTMHGIDMNCDSHGEVYPGMPEFQLALSAGLKGGKPKAVVPLSARPSFVANTWLNKIKAIRMTQDNVTAKALSAVGSKWYGASADEAFLNTDEALYNEGYKSGVGKAVWAMMKRKSPWEAMAFMKYEGWLRFMSESDPQSSIFVGDNGQGDVRSAMMMLRSHQEHAEALSELSDNETQYEVDPILAAFIHHVQDGDINEAETTATNAKKKYRKEFKSLQQAGKIILFHQYAHAALIAFARRFINQKGLESVFVGIGQQCKGKWEQRKACNYIWNWLYNGEEHEGRRLCEMVKACELIRQWLA